MVSYLVTVAETEEEVVSFGSCRKIFTLVGQSAGQNYQLPSTERANQMDLSDEVKAIIEANRQRHIVNT